MKKLLIFALLLNACGDTGKTNPPDYSGEAVVMIDSSRIYDTGESLSLTHEIELEPGRRIGFHLDDGSTVTLSGPVSGSLGALLQTDSNLQQWAKAGTDVLSKTANEGHVLTVRSADGGTNVEWFPTSIPVPFNGRFCVTDADVLTFYVQGSSREPVSFKLTQGDEDVQLSIPKGKNSVIDWPDNFPITGKFRMEKKGWFEEKSFEIVEIKSSDYIELAKSECTYHLEQLMNLQSK